MTKPHAEQLAKYYRNRAKGLREKLSGDTVASALDEVAIGLEFYASLDEPAQPIGFALLRHDAERPLGFGLHGKDDGL